MQQQHGVVGAVGLAQRRQQLAHRLQMAAQLEVTEATQALEIPQALPGPIQAPGDEIVRLVAALVLCEQLAIDGQHPLPDPFQGRQPGAVVGVGGKVGIV